MNDFFLNLKYEMLNALTFYHNLDYRRIGNYRDFYINRFMKVE